jgi:hypothetical protein
MMANPLSVLKKAALKKAPKKVTFTDSKGKKAKTAKEKAAMIDDVNEKIQGGK